MKNKIIYLMLLLFVGGPMLQSCGSSRGCKNLRKYRKNRSKKSIYAYQDALIINQLNHNLS